MVTASIAKVVGVTAREVFESEDEDYLSFVRAIVEMTVEARDEIAAEIKRRAGR